MTINVFFDFHVLIENFAKQELKLTEVLAKNIDVMRFFSIDGTNVDLPLAIIATNTYLLSDDHNLNIKTKNLKTLYC